MFCFHQLVSVIHITEAKAFRLFLKIASYLAMTKPTGKGFKYLTVVCEDTDNGKR
jgi:hypothetical protein